MPCEHPLTAYRPTRAPFGALVFTRDGLPPRDQTYLAQQVPCGTCILCRQEQARQQAIRIAHEAQQHEANCFVTLTYDDNNLPKYGSLQYSDLQKFWKRARKEFGTLRYYAVGEYGDKSMRAHYHACIFGHDFTEGRIITTESPHRLWINPLLTRCWGLGNVSVGALNFATARYTAQYVTKKLRSGQKYVRTDEETGELIPLEQPRAFMSKNLGRTWWDQWNHTVTAHDRVIIDARPQKPPRAYDKWLRQKSPIAAEIQTAQRIKKMQARGPINPHARAETARARAKSKALTAKL